MSDLAPAQRASLANSTIAGDQVVPITAALAGGGYVVVWTSTPSQQSSHGADQVFAQVYDASGQPVGGEMQVFADTAHPHDATGVVGLADGSFVVAASSLYGTDGAVSSNAVTQRIGASGQPIGGELTVAHSDTADRVASSGVYAGADGGYYVTVVQQNTVVGTADAAVTRFSLQHFDAGGPATGSTASMRSVLQTIDSQQAAVLANGNIVAAAEAMDAQGTRLNWDEFTPAGTLVSSFTIATTPSSGGYPTAHPIVAALAGGNSVLVWHDNASGSVQAQLVDAGAQPAGSPVTVTQHLSMAHVDALADGGFLVSFLEPQAGTANVQIIGQQYDSAAHAVGASLQLSPAITNNTFQAQQDQWDVAATADGGFVVTYNVAPGGTGEDIVQQKWIVAAAAGPGGLQGTSGDDHLTGTSGNDRLDGLGGNDMLDGGAGTDTAVIETSVAAVQSYSLGTAGASVTTALGTDTLVNIERVQFSDALFALDTTPGDHAWQAAALFHAGFGVLPARAELSRWTAVADQSASMGELAQHMIDFHAPGVSSHELVASLYQQLTHQAPSAEVVQGYVDQIGGGKTFATQGDLLAYAANLSLNTDGLASFVGSVQLLDVGAF